MSEQNAPFQMSNHFPFHYSGATSMFSLYGLTNSGLNHLATTQHLKFCM